MTEKTHYRKAFNSPYLSSADIVEPTILTISKVVLETDKTKKTKDQFNTAYFSETEIRKGEKLKPMILNASNSRTMKQLTNSPFIDDWQNIKVTVYVDHNIRFGRDLVDGLRISTELPTARHVLQRDTKQWDNAIAAIKRDGNLDKVKARVDIKPEDEKYLMELVNDFS